MTGTFFSGGGGMTLRFALIGLFLTGMATHAQDRSPQGEAQWMLERLTGVKQPLDNPLIGQMATLIQQGDRIAAAELATAQPQFLNVTVKQTASQMSTREETIREPLNDFSATFMGAVRDGLDARQLLFGNFYYAATDSTRLNGITIPSNLEADILRSNNHYAALERANLDVGAALVRVDGQRIVNAAATSIPSPDPAGLLTTRAFLGAHAIAGTNRRLVEYTMRQFACIPIAGWADTLGSDLRIGRDIDRRPGGDEQKFLTTCKGCHTVMDGFRGAFAKWDFRDIGGVGPVAIHVANGVTAGGLTPNVDPNNRGVIFKMNRNDFVQYAGGYVSTDDSFVNNAIRGSNATLFGWRGMAPDSDAALSGRTTGAHAFGRLVANSQRFSQCMAKRIWAQVCHTELGVAQMEAIYVSMGLELETKQYNLKKLYEAIAAHPKCRI